MDTLIINNREEFAQWAIERANSVIGEQGSALATAARSGEETQLASAAKALGQTKFRSPAPIRVMNPTS